MQHGVRSGSLASTRPGARPATLSRIVRVCAQERSKRSPRLGFLPIPFACKRPVPPIAPQPGSPGPPSLPPSTLLPIGALFDDCIAEVVAAAQSAQIADQTTRTSSDEASVVGGWNPDDVWPSGQANLVALVKAHVAALTKACRGP